VASRRIVGRASARRRCRLCHGSRPEGRPTAPRGPSAL